MGQFEKAISPQMNLKRRMRRWIRVFDHALEKQLKEIEFDKWLAIIDDAYDCLDNLVVVQNLTQTIERAGRAINSSVQQTESYQMM